MSKQSKRVEGVKLIRVAGSPYWYVEGRDCEGALYRVTTKQTDREAARPVARRIQLERAVPRVRPYALSSAFVALLAYKELCRVSEAEVEITKTKSARVMEFFGHNFDCNAFAADDGPARVEQYVKHRRGQQVNPTYKTQRGVKDSTIRKELGKLYEALALARRDGKFIGDVKTLQTKVLAPDKPCERWLPEQEFVALWDQLSPRITKEGKRRRMRGGEGEEDDRREWLIVFCSTGARYGELHRIEAKHIDHELRRLFIIGRKGRAEFRERWVPLSPQCYAVLCARAELYPTGLLFPKKWLRSNVSQTLRRACERAGIARCSANDLRRTFVTWQGKFGTAENDVKKMVGHSPMSRMVGRVYHQLHHEAGRAAVDNFPQVGIEPPPTPPAVETAEELPDNVLPLRRGA